MDEPLLKSGQYPNIAIEAGTDPAEVMREHGRQVIPDGEKYELDSREALEADVVMLFRCPAEGDPLVKCVLGLLDRQAAITANETSHDNPYVGLVRGKLWERTEISDYYCGRCGWKVTDHDSYCPECGGALHKTPNKPNSQFDALKTAENAENAASKNEIHNFDDSREQLEADIMNAGHDNSTEEIFGWLDRQAAITERKCMKQATTRYIGWDCAECAEGLGKELDARCDPLKKRIVELTAERDQLQTERDMLQGANDFLADGFKGIQAERDQLSRDLTAEHALVVQFEHDNEELRHANNTLRASVAGLKMTVERFKARESGDARRSG